MSDHERIWLQPGAETTWCKDRINPDDVEYVRADIAAATIERLTKERAANENLAIANGARAKEEHARADSLAAELAKAREALTKAARTLDMATGFAERGQYPAAAFEYRQAADAARAALAAKPETRPLNAGERDNLHDAWMPAPAKPEESRP